MNGEGEWRKIASIAVGEHAAHFITPKELDSFTPLCPVFNYRQRLSISTSSASSLT